MVVQEDDKSNTLNLFAADKLEKIQRKMEELSSNKLTSFKLQDIKGVETKFESKVYGWPSKLFFWISVVELKNKFVTTITWTTIDRKDKFQKDAELIIKSFRRK